GGNNCGEGLGGRGNIANASLEQLIAWQPDIVITLDRAFFQGVTTKPGWDQGNGGKQATVYLAPTLPGGWIDAPPSLNRLIGLRWLLKTFYPAEAGIDLGAATPGFYELFYGGRLDESHA